MRQVIANPDNSLADFGSHMRFFESRLCRSALVTAYTPQVRPLHCVEFF